jgi:Tol biopolymer transport system component
MWTPDGHYYVFRSTAQNGASADIFALAEPGGFLRKRSSIPVQLTFGPLAFAMGAITPDGSHLLVGGYSPRGELSRYDQQSKQIVPYLGGISANQVAFSRDGKWIAYINVADVTLWISRVDGTGKLQLTYPPKASALPRWSPDGTKIAFMSAEMGKPWKIFVVSTQAGTAEELLPTDTAEGDPGWSPDGTRIVFSRLPDSTNSSDIRILDLATRQANVIAGSTGMFSPRWSPDGRYIAAMDFERNPKNLHVYDFETGKWADWVRDPVGIGYPMWTADGKFIIYAGLSGFNRVKLGSNSIQHLYSLQNANAYSTNLGPWSSIAPDDSVIYTRDVSTQDIYKLDVEFP